VAFGELGQQRYRLLAVRRIVKHERYLFAFELVVAAGLVGDLMHDHIRRGPIGAEQREVPREYAAIRGFRAAVTHRDYRDLIDRCFLG
jgi:hypothetical protein